MSGEPTISQLQKCSAKSILLEMRDSVKSNKSNGVREKIDRQPCLGRKVGDAYKQNRTCCST
jgi:hypothetical protein